MRLGRLSAVLSACLLVGISSAQVDECTTSSAAGFDFQVATEDGNQAGTAARDAMATYGTGIFSKCQCAVRHALGPRLSAS